MMDRRELLHRASMLLGGAISTSAAAGVLAGCTAMPEPSPSPAPAGTAGAFLTAEESATVTAMADHILPRTDTPGALDVGVPAFIDRMLASYYQSRERDAVRAGLTQVAADAKALRGKAFAALTGDEQVELMKRYDREQFDYTRANAGGPPHFFRMLKELTILGFCTSEAGATKTMSYVQTPGPFRGDVPLSEVGKASAL